MWTRSTFIIFVACLKSTIDWYPNVHASSDYKPEAVLHSYKNFNAFVMKLTEEEAERMAGIIINLLSKPLYDS